MSRILFFLMVLTIGSFSCDENDELSMAACELTRGVSSSYEVVNNPYANIEWGTWRTCLAQFHDHIDTVQMKLREYDNARYNAVSVMHYAGDETRDEYRRNRLWPLSEFFADITDEEEFYATSTSLKRFIPSMEEVGFDHLLSPFMTQYITKYSPKIHPRREEFHYTSTQEALDLINKFGGFPIVAHPTNHWNYYLNLRGFQGIEIYNAYYAYKKKVGELRVDYNEHFLSVWDMLLRQKSTKVWGFAVNDHFGPFAHKPLMKGNEDVFDSGKVLLFVPDYSMKSIMNAVTVGSFLAVWDHGQEKNLYPKIQSVEVAASSITINTDATDIRWIYCSHEIGVGPILNLSVLPAGINYVRAEVSNEYGKTFLQPFALSPL